MAFIVSIEKTETIPDAPNEGRTVSQLYQQEFADLDVPKVIAFLNAPVRKKRAATVKKDAKQ